MANLKCKDCPYWWADENGVKPDVPYCHYEGDDNYAPCEEVPHTARYGVIYEGYIFDGDGDGMNAHDAETWEDAMWMYECAGGDDGYVQIVDNEYGVTFYRGEWS